MKKLKSQAKVIMKPCLKKPYENQKDAKKVLDEILLTSEKDKKPLRVYKCDKCSKWHLTSFTNRKQKVIKQLTSEEGKQERRINKAAMFFASKKGWDIDLG